MQAKLWSWPICNSGWSQFRHRMMICMTGVSVILVSLGLTALSVGCSRESVKEPPRDFCVHVQDAQGLGAGSVVQWRGVEVGRVHSVAMGKGLVLIDVQLHSEYRDKFCEGLKARPVKGFLGRGPITLELFGGDDAKRPILKRGMAIPEATLSDTVTPRQIKVVGILVAVGILFLVILRIMHKLAAIALAVGLLVFSGWFMHRQWEKHGDDFEVAHMEMRLSDMARATLSETDAQKVWIDVQTDLAEAIREVGGMGKERVAKVSAGMRTKLEGKSKELAKQGKESAANELRKFIDTAFSTPAEELNGKKSSQ